MIGEMDHLSSEMAHMIDPMQKVFISFLVLSRDSIDSHDLAESAYTSILDASNLIFLLEN